MWTFLLQSDKIIFWRLTSLGNWGTTFLRKHDKQEAARIPYILISLVNLVNWQWDNEGVACCGRLLKATKNMRQCHFRPLFHPTSSQHSFRPGHCLPHLTCIRSTCKIRQDPIFLHKSFCCHVNTMCNLCRYIWRWWRYVCRRLLVLADKYWSSIKFLKFNNSFYIGFKM